MVTSHLCRAAPPISEPEPHWPISVVVPAHLRSHKRPPISRELRVNKSMVTTGSLLIPISTLNSLSVSCKVAFVCLCNLLVRIVCAKPCLSRCIYIYICMYGAICSDTWRRNQFVTSSIQLQDLGKANVALGSLKLSSAQ